MVKDTLEYDFDRERKFKYKGLSEDAFVEHLAAFISGIWQIHPFREGNTRVAALFAIKYLQSMRYDVTNDLFAEKSWFFRNALVRANYVNIKLNVDKTQIPLEEFFKVLIFGYDIELRNRYLRIGYEHGSQYAEAVGNMHRDDVGINVGIKSSDVGLNLLKSRLSCDPRFTETEMQVADAIFENNKITARELKHSWPTKRNASQGSRPARESPPVKLSVSLVLLLQPWAVTARRGRRLSVDRHCF
jgi:hypothetical protein